MIIAIDGYEANVPNRVGIGRYAYDLLTHMYAILKRQNGTDLTIRVYVPSKPLWDMPKATPRWQYRVRGPSPLWTYIGLPLAIFHDTPRADAVFSPTHYIPRFIPTPRVMAIMDTSYLVYPAMFRAGDRYKLKHWTRYAATHAEKIFTISQFSKNAIIKAYQVPTENVIVTYPGLSMQHTTQSSQDQAIFDRYGISRHFILSVGTIQPRKNYIRLIESFAQFLKTNKQKFGEIQLVIIGKKGWLYDKILTAPEKYGISGRVKFLHTVPDADMPRFYRQALCFALPSLYEGFGLPVLEAMAFKCPVVVSSTSSLPEIAGKAGIYVDPKDTASITHGLLAAVRERNLMQGRWRIQKGLAQVKQFSWEKAAGQTLDILTKVASSQ